MIAVLVHYYNNFSTVAVQFQHGCSTVAVRWQYVGSTVSVWLQYGCSTIAARLQYDRSMFAVRLQCVCSTLFLFEPSDVQTVVLSFFFYYLISISRWWGSQQPLPFHHSPIRHASISSFCSRLQLIHLLPSFVPLLKGHSSRRAATTNCVYSSSLMHECVFSSILENCVLLYTYAHIRTHALPSVKLLCRTGFYDSRRWVDVESMKCDPVNKKETEKIERIFSLSFYPVPKLLASSVSYWFLIKELRNILLTFVFSCCDVIARTQWWNMRQTGC